MCWETGSVCVCGGGGGSGAAGQRDSGVNVRHRRREDEGGVGSGGGEGFGTIDPRLILAFSAPPLTPPVASSISGGACVYPREYAVGLDEGPRPGRGGGGHGGGGGRRSDDDDVFVSDLKTSRFSGRCGTCSQSPPRLKSGTDRCGTSAGHGAVQVGGRGG